VGNRRSPVTSSRRVAIGESGLGEKTRKGSEKENHQSKFSRYKEKKQGGVGKKESFRKKSIPIGKQSKAWGPKKRKWG